MYTYMLTGCYMVTPRNGYTGRTLNELFKISYCADFKRQTAQI